MFKKIIFNAVVIIVLIMICSAIIRANKPKQSVFKATLNNLETQDSKLTPKEAKYYKVIEE